MTIEKIDYNLIKNELEEKFNILESTSNSLLKDNPEIKSLFDNLKEDIQSLYSIIVELTTSYSLDHNRNVLSSNVLLLKDVQQELFNNLQIISQKLMIPENRLITVLMENFILNNSKINNESKKLHLDYSHLRDEILKDNLTFSISDKDFIEILNEDLEDSSFKYDFYGIDIVIFKKLSIENFSRKIGKVVNCKTVFIPKTIPKLLIYSKLQNIEELHLYDSEDEIDDFIFIFN